jgi:hypothetical protein
MLIDKVERQRAGRVLAFIDAHYVLATAAARGQDAAREFTAQLRAFAETGSGTTARVTAAVGLPLADALVAYRRGDYACCVEHLYPLRRRLAVLGGSHAQRDLFTQILIDAMLRCGRFAHARALLAERVMLRPDNLWAWRASAAAFADLGDAANLAAAQERIRQLAVAVNA